MAADTEALLNTEKPCCAKRKEKFLKLKENRDFLRKALQGVEPKIVQLQNEKLGAVKAYEAERERAEFEKQAKETESAVRAGLEKEISDLKSEIASSQTNRESGDQDDDGEVILLRTRVSELEGEVHRFKKLLEEEREKGDLERKKVEEGKKEACKFEKEAKLNESAVRAGLENDILNLKFEIASLKESGGPIDRDEDGEMILLRTRVSEGEAEISRLSELVDKERKSRKLEKKKAHTDKKKAEDALKIEAEARSKESSGGAGLENEIVLLRIRVSEGEAEISRLSELLDKERKDGELEKKEFQAEKRKAEEARKIEAEARSKESSVRDGLENEIVLLQTRVSEAEAEISRLKELLDQERKRAGSEKKKAKAEKKKADAQKLETEAKLKECAGLENEIFKLKSEIASLQEKRGLRDQDEGDEALLLQSRVSEGEAEIQRLNELLEKERNKGDLEKKKLMDEKNRSDYLSQKLEEVKQMVNREKKKAESERQKLEEQNKCVEEEKKNLMDEKKRSGYLSQKLEEAKQMANREKKCADIERAKVEELKKCVEEEKKRLMDEKNHSDYLSRMLEEAKQMANREKKRAESESAKVEEQKKCVEEEKKKLEEVRQKSESLEKEIEEIMSARKMKEALPVTSDVSRNAGGDLLLLEKQLKLEKMHVKHVKRVAKFEKTRNNLLEQELSRLKQEFFHFSYRLNELDGCFTNGIEGIDASAKVVACMHHKHWMEVY